MFLKHVPNNDGFHYLQIFVVRYNYELLSFIDIVYLSVSTKYAFHRIIGAISWDLELT
jgi:hypothetical protein